MHAQLVAHIVFDDDPKWFADRLGAPPPPPPLAWDVLMKAQ
jgi:hypothetical protein